jgi:3-dehydroquinate synthetase
MKDKKREQHTIHFVLLNGIGDCTVEQMPLSELQTIFQTGGKTLMV